MSNFTQIELRDGEDALIATGKTAVEVDPVSDPVLSPVIVIEDVQWVNMSGREALCLLQKNVRFRAIGDHGQTHEGDYRVASISGTFSVVKLANR